MEQFQTAYTPLLRYIIAPILPDERDREECLSDVLLRVWDSIDAFDPGRAALTMEGFLFWEAVPTFPETVLFYNFSVTIAHKRSCWQYPYTLTSELLAPGFHAPSWQWRTYQWTSEVQLAPEGQYDPGKY